MVEGAEEEDGVDVVEGGDFGKSPVLDLLGRRNAIQSGSVVESWKFLHKELNCAVECSEVHLIGK